MSEEGREEGRERDGWREGGWEREGGKETLFDDVGEIQEEGEDTRSCRGVDRRVLVVVCPVILSFLVLQHLQITL